MSIRPSHDPLRLLPSSLLRLEPHPYQKLGAPYGTAGSPFVLRSEVIDRLLQAQALLQAQRPGWRLAVFDGWRPLAVQAFMVNYTIDERCRARGVNPDCQSPERSAIVEEVGRFWAPPNEDRLAPPPHTTGAAVDLTLADHDCQELSMGSPIDAIGAVSEPDHFGDLAATIEDAELRAQAMSWHGRRSLLRWAMESVGFAQHPNEWWHFSWGDQLWAWRGGKQEAIYGRVDNPGV